MQSNVYRQRVPGRWCGNAKVHEKKLLVMPDGVARRCMLEDVRIWKEGN